MAGNPVEPRSFETTGLSFGHDFQIYAASNRFTSRNLSVLIRSGFTWSISMTFDRLAQPAILLWQCAREAAPLCQRVWRSSCRRGTLGRASRVSGLETSTIWKTLQPGHGRFGGDLQKPKSVCWMQPICARRWHSNGLCCSCCSQEMAFKRKCARQGRSMAQPVPGLRWHLGRMHKEVPGAASGATSSLRDSHGPTGRADPSGDLLRTRS